MDIHLKHETEDAAREFGRALVAPFQEMWDTFLEILKAVFRAR